MCNFVQCAGIYRTVRVSVTVNWNLRDRDLVSCLVGEKMKESEEEMEIVSKFGGFDFSKNRN